MKNLRQNNYNHVKLHVAIILSAVAVLASITGLFLNGGNTEQAVFNAITRMEALKVGGMENRSKVAQLYNNTAYQSQQGQAIDAALQRLGEPTTPQKDETATDSANNDKIGKILSKEQINAIKNNAYVEGNKNAKIIIVEYTDPECPFCVRHVKDNTIKNTIASHPEVAHIVKVVQGVNHEGTKFKSTATLCAGKLKGENAYYTLFNEIMGNTQGNFPSFTLVTTDDVYSYADKLGITKANLDTCLADTEINQVYDARWQEAISLGASGTPGNIIINTESGKYVHLAGAYPASAFDDAINQIQ